LPQSHEYFSISILFEKLTAMVQSRRLTLSGHIVHTDDNADAERILSTLLPEDWKRTRGCLHITWLSTIQQDLGSHNLTLPDAMDTAQNWSVWRMWSTYSTTHYDDHPVRLPVILSSFQQNFPSHRCMWLSGRVVGMLDLRSTGRRFKSQPLRCRVQPRTSC